MIVMMALRDAGKRFTIPEFWLKYSQSHGANIPFAGGSAIWFDTLVEETGY